MTAKELINSIVKWRKSAYENHAKHVELATKYCKTDDELLRYFLYANMQKAHPNYCPLFEPDTPCHDMEREKLCCYFCECMHYELGSEACAKDDAEYVGRCAISSKDAKWAKADEKLYVLDCSGCLHPHRISVAMKEVGNKGVMKKTK